MPRNRIKTTLKLAFSFVLCLSLLELNGKGATAQTTNAPATPAAASPAAVTTPAPSATTTNAIAPTLAPSPIAAPPTATPQINQASILGMVRNSDRVVQAVMAFLLLCSALSWAVFFYKSITLAIARRNAINFSKAFSSATTMDNATVALKPVGDGAALYMWRAAKQEWDQTLRATGAVLSAHQTNRLLQRLVLCMGSAQERSLSRLGNWMGLLATIGSTAPFIGLFGTVWGILDSFEHISASSNTSLTVVAPGIAEALLATAVGLFTAIPATMFYNRFAREVGKVTGTLDNVMADIIVFASRDLELAVK